MSARHVQEIATATLLLGLTAYSVAEEIVLSTYYPSPRGVYDELRTTNTTLLAMDSGGVGIGMSAPPTSDEKLHVQGNAVIDGYQLWLTGLDADPAFGLGPGSIYYNTTSDTLREFQNVVGWVDLTSPWKVVDNQDMYSLVTGNVGIGTEDPQATLHVADGEAPQVRFRSEGALTTLRFKPLAGASTTELELDSAGALSLSTGAVAPLPRISLDQQAGIIIGESKPPSSPRPVLILEAPGGVKTYFSIDSSTASLAIGPDPRPDQGLLIVDLDTEQVGIGKQPSVPPGVPSTSTLFDVGGNVAVDDVWVGGSTSGQWLGDGTFPPMALSGFCNSATGQVKSPALIWVDDSCYCPNSYGRVQIGHDSSGDRIYACYGG